VEREFCDLRRAPSRRQCRALRFGRVLLLARRQAPLARRRGAGAGLVGINEGALAAEAAPFGGFKESGYERRLGSWPGRVHALQVSVPRTAL